MSPWKCPHCGTPQAESARCWACKRSPLTCSTCREFRRSVAGKLGYCGLDRSRKVLTGDEVRPCWAAPTPADEPPLLGLFGSLEPSPPPAAVPTPPPSRPEPVPVGPGVPRAASVPANGADERHRPAPTAAAAAKARWDALVADMASGSPLGSDPEGGASPSLPHRPTPGSTSVLPWLASAARPAAPARAPAPAYPMTADEPAPSEPIRWRHRAVDEPAPLPSPPPGESATRRPGNLSLIPATLANRLRRHIGTRGPRAIAIDPGGTPDATSTASARLTLAPRVATPIATTQATPHGRLVEAPPVPGTIVSLGDQLRRAEQLRRERDLLDGQRLGGDHLGEPPA